MKKHTIYRDSKTGRFTSKATWKRSRAHGGKRYIRKRAVVSGLKRTTRRSKAVRPAALPSEAPSAAPPEAPSVRLPEPTAAPIESLEEYYEETEFEEEETELETGIDYEA